MTWRQVAGFNGLALWWRLSAIPAQRTIILPIKDSHHDVVMPFAVDQSRLALEPLDSEAALLV